MSSEERRLRQELAKLEAQKEFQDYVESLTESDRRDLLALYYLGRGAARTLKGARTRIRGYKVEHIPWALMQSAKLDNRLEEGIRIYSRGKFDLYPPTKGRKAKGSSPPGGPRYLTPRKKRVNWLQILFSLIRNFDFSLQCSRSSFPVRSGQMNMWNQLGANSTGARAFCLTSRRSGSHS